MTRSTPSTVTTPFRTGSGAEPIWLFEIPTGLASPATLRYTTAKYAVTFGSQTFEPIPAVPPSQSFQGPGEAGGVALTVGDVDGTISGYVEAGATFEGQTVVLYLTDLAATGGAGTDAIPDEYVIESLERGQGYVTFAMRNAFGTFDTKVPRLVATRATFPGLSAGPLS